MEERKTFREITAGMTPVEKIKYFWNYYKWLTILCIGVVVLAVWMGIVIGGEASKNYIAIMEMVNCETYSVDESDFFDRFREEYGYGSDTLIDLGTTMEINLETGGQTSSQGLQILAAEFVSGELDVFVSDEPLFALEAENHAFEDLREVLPKDLLDKYSEKIYYYEDQENGERVPIGLYIDESNVCTKEHFYLPGTKAIIGVGSQYQSDEEDTANIIEFFMK